MKKMSDEKNYGLFKEMKMKFGFIFNEWLLSDSDIIGVGDEFEMYLKNQTSIMSDKTVANYKNVIMRFLGKYKPTGQNINIFITEHAKTGRTYYTRYAFKHFLEFLGRGEYFRMVIKTPLKVPKRKIPYIPVTVVIQLVDTIEDERYRLIAAIQTQTGCRSKEAIELKSNQIEKVGEDVRVRIISTKTNIERTYTLKYYKDEIYDVSQHRSGYLFLKAGEKIVTIYKYYYDVILDTFNDYKGFTTHGFRAALITTLLEKGVPLHKVMLFVGHKNANTTARYDTSHGLSSDEANKILFD